MQVEGDKQRQQNRDLVGGSVRLMVDSPSGLWASHGQLVDVSEVRFTVFVRRSMDTQHAGRVSFEVAGKAVWFPMVTRWVREDREAGRLAASSTDRRTKNDRPSERCCTGAETMSTWRERHSSRVSLAAGVVSEPAECTVSEALTLLWAHAELSGDDLEAAALAVVTRQFWFEPCAASSRRGSIAESLEVS